MTGLVMLNECEASSKEWHRVVMQNHPIRRAWGVKHLPRDDRVTGLVMLNECEAASEG